VKSACAFNIEANQSISVTCVDDASLRCWWLGDREEQRGVTVPRGHVGWSGSSYSSLSSSGASSGLSAGRWSVISCGFVRSSSSRLSS